MYALLSLVKNKNKVAVSMHLFLGPLLHFIVQASCSFITMDLCCSLIIDVIYDISGIALSIKDCLDIWGILCCHMHFRIVSMCV